MANLAHIFKIGQKVFYKNEDFDAISGTKMLPCVVKETFEDHIIITDLTTNTDLWIEEGFNAEFVFPEYNLKAGMILS